MGTGVESGLMSCDKDVVIMLSRNLLLYCFIFSLCVFSKCSITRQCVDRKMHRRDENVRFSDKILIKREEEIIKGDVMQEQDSIK